MIKQISMNPYYQYKYSNGFQFISLANPTMLTCDFHEGSEKPKLLGIWRFKGLKDLDKNHKIVNLKNFNC
jgi:hypothetical protein